MTTGERKYLEQLYGIDLSDFKGIDKRKCLRNMVEPEIGKYILDCAIADINSDFVQTEDSLFRAGVRQDSPEGYTAGRDRGRDRAGETD